MTQAKTSSPSRRLLVKESAGWFPAGNCVRRARGELSDGAFRLYVSLCLDADPFTGTLEATHQELANLLGRSKRIIGVYVHELERKAVCGVRPARNQHARTVFEICEDYWPYLREGRQKRSKESDYVARVRKAFLSMGCVKGPFESGNERLARKMERRGIPVETVEDAMALAAVRKYISWLNNGPSAPIGSLTYLEPVIAEIQAQPWPDGYREYIHYKRRKLAELWRQTVGATCPSRSEGDTQT